MKLVRDDIALIWNNFIDRFQVIHADKRTKHKRIVLTIEDDNGNFKHPDERDIIHLANVIAWDFLDMYPDPVELGSEILKRKKEKKLKQDELRREYRRWFIKDNKKMMRKAVENLLRGITSNPVEQRDKKIIIYQGGGA